MGERVSHGIAQQGSLEHSLHNRLIAAVPAEKLQLNRLVQVIDKTFDCQFRKVFCA